MKKPKKINFFAIGKKVISNEIDALQEVSSGISKNEFNNVCNFLLETKGNLIFLGIGKSGKVSEMISATLSSLGKPSFYINAAEASHGDLGAITKKDSLIIFSYSGETEELVNLLPTLKQKKVNICSVTGNKKSSIALSSKAHITLNLKKEADMLNLAPTSSTTAMMMIGDAISVAITNYEGISSQSCINTFIDPFLILKIFFLSKFLSKNFIKAKGYSSLIKTLPISVSLAKIVSFSFNFPSIISIGNNLFESLFFNLILAVFSWPT